MSTTRQEGGTQDTTFHPSHYDEQERGGTTNESPRNRRSHHKHPRGEKGEVRGVVGLRVMRRCGGRGGGECRGHCNGRTTPRHHRSADPHRHHQRSARSESGHHAIAVNPPTILVGRGGVRGCVEGRATSGQQRSHFQCGRPPLVLARATHHDEDNLTSRRNRVCVCVCVWRVSSGVWGRPQASGVPPPHLPCGVHAPAPRGGR